MKKYSVLTDTKKYIESFLKIRTKDGRIRPFILNPPQIRLYNEIARLEAEEKPIRIVILKSRQMGFSTLTEAILFKKTATKKLRNTMIITHKDEATTNLFNMSKLFYEELPDALRPMLKSSNAKELLFENPTRNARQKKNKQGLKSKIKCSTAGGKGVGRSDTLSYVHMSEVAFWERMTEIMVGLVQAVPNTADTMIIVESTANGFNAFKQFWDMSVRGENDFVPLFFPWFEDESYQMPYRGEELTEEESELKQAFSLRDEQIMWRRWCIKNNCGGDINLFKQEYPATPEEAFISTGSCVFGNKDAIILRIQALESAQRKIKRGYFTYKEQVLGLHKIILTDITFVEDEGGEIFIYQEPQAGIPYVLGGDTAGEGSDNFTAQVLNNQSAEQVATLVRKYDEDEYAKQIYCLGRYYNFALIAVEVNFSTQPIKVLEALNYPRMYEREVFDDYTGKTRKAFGFQTTSKSRPLLVAELVEHIRDNLHCVYDVATLRECLSFVKNKNGRAEAESGEHDDLVMGFAIALLARSQQSVQVTQEKTANHKDWSADMWEDYKRADAEGKKYLLAKYERERRTKDEVCDAD